MRNALAYVPKGQQAMVAAGGIVRNFVCGSGMMGGKEPNHAETQRASYS